MSNSSLPIESPLDVRAKGAGWWSKVMVKLINYIIYISQLIIKKKTKQTNNRELVIITD